MLWMARQPLVLNWNLSLSIPFPSQNSRDIEIRIEQSEKNKIKKRLMIKCQKRNTRKIEL